MDIKESEKLSFSFGWLALKLLGKSLYSNTWSAISELVANGFDAGAKNVYVYFDISQKKDSIIEIIDDGTGMDRRDMGTYVKVGFNKRKATAPKLDDGYLPMGRKGIGKLAALYLSENYYLFTKTKEDNSKWKMTYQEDPNNQDEKPFLSEVDNDVDISCIEQWEECKTGTLLRMNHVNLTGLGEVAFSALAKKLSNFFALDSMDGRQIHLCINDDQNKERVFEPIKKEIAFGNMAFIDYNAKDEHSKIPEIIKKNEGNIIKLPYNKLNGNQYFNHVVKLENFEDIENLQVEGIIECENVNGEMVKKKYLLTGWIGLHASIDVNQAQKNDGAFTRSKFYNPIQLRLYVRNKLAIENFLNVINNTQAFVNYIEGEIHFDILDEDDLPDIATSNRQNLDEHDPRVQLLKKIVSKIITNLIGKRTSLANSFKDCQDRLLDEQNSNAKKQFTKEVEKEVDRFAELNAVQKSTLTTLVSNKIKGDVTPKNDYLLFISHSREDKIITDFIYYILKFKGVEDFEIFYTSREDNVEQYSNPEALAMQIRNNILKENVLLLYLTSNSYKKSEFCMFEGGAGWATRSIGEYIILSLTYPEIPQFITNGKLEFCLEKNGDIPLDRSTYLFVRKVLNIIIEHLNAGRRANACEEISLFDETEIPADLELCKKGEDIQDYMDKDIKEHWNFYISDHIKEYMEKRHK